MKVEEALTIVEALVFAKTGKHLSTLQATIFREAWSGQKYEQIAQNSYCSDVHIKMVGAALWELLSEVLGEKVSKKNFRAALERRDRLISHTNQITFKKNLYPQIQREYSYNPTLLNLNQLGLDQLSDFMEFPHDPVPLNSNFYIKRDPIEESVYEAVFQPGSLIRIKASKQMGKTSLIYRIIAHARQAGLRTVLINLQQADREFFNSLNKFLRWFCANVSRQLNLELKLNDYWDEDIGSKLSCTAYFQTYLLKEIDTPLVLVFDEVNHIFEHREISQDFLLLLRSWHEEAVELDIWQKLRIVVVYTTEVYIPLNIYQSPFNVGLPIKLPEFSLEQVKDLAARYKLDWTSGFEAEQLMKMVGGHPYLVQIALYSLKSQNMTLEQLLQEAPTLAGIYSHHLRLHLATLQEHPKLAKALKNVVTATQSVRLEPIAAYHLENMGLVKLNGDEVIPTCQLYRLYFQEKLNTDKKLMTDNCN